MATGLRRSAPVVAASSGAEALRVWRAQRRAIAAVILDLCMPGMDGEDLYARLRFSAPDLALIVHSAEHRRGLEHAIAADPRAAFVRKPCRLTALMAALNQLAAA